MLFITLLLAGFAVAEVRSGIYSHGNHGLWNWLTGPASAPWLNLTQEFRRLRGNITRQRRYLRGNVTQQRKHLRGQLRHRNERLGFPMRMNSTLDKYSRLRGNVTHLHKRLRGRMRPSIEMPRFPIGVNSTPDAYLPLCPSRKYHVCFRAGLSKRYTIHEIFRGPLTDQTDAVTRARRLVNCSGQPSVPMGRTPSPFPGVSFVRAALLPPPRSPHGTVDPLANASNMDAESAMIALGRPGWRPNMAAMMKLIPAEPSTDSTSGDLRPLRCSADSSLLNERALLLLGVPSIHGPVGRKRRDSARNSWLRSPEVGVNVTVCFLLSAFHPPEETHALIDEAREHGDILFLPVAESRMILRKKTKYSNYTKMGRSMPTFKQFGFFDHAATAVPGIPFVGKVDDDTAVNLRQIVPLLLSMQCYRYSFTAAINWGSIIPLASFAGTRGERCGFGWDASAALKNFGQSWGTPHSSHWIRPCDEFGAVPPFPYGTGAGYIFSSPLLHWVTKDLGVRKWIADARGPTKDEYQWQKYEDTATGYWLTYANETVHYINIGRWVHDFVCRPDGAAASLRGGLYRPASPNSLLVHNLKHHGFNAAYNQIQLGAEYDHEVCVRDGGKLWANNKGRGRRLSPKRRLRRSALWQ
mmetsp:Transcript_22860/g.69984  ORF Transcript_22860/g.69984 Transcript_22860/m.69984 type:complete len:638 (-) Transcript_22860:332-2245(-)